MDAWKELTGKNIILPLTKDTVINSPHNFIRLTVPISPCLAVMRMNTQLHIGIHYMSKILHLQETGVEYVPIDIAIRCAKNKRIHYYAIT